MKMIRGDTKKIQFQRKKSDGTVILDRPDSLYFTVKEKYEDRAAVLQKTLDDMTLDAEGVYHFTIEPEDTDSLKFKRYVFDIQVKQNGIKTTIARGLLQIEEEVTHAANEV